MNEKSLTEGGWKRTLKVGVTAAKVGTKVLQKKSHQVLFQDDKYSLAKEEEIGDMIFLALGQLKGLALKGAQLLGQEVNLIPEPIRIKLQQSFNQAPALNRAIVRKIMKTQLPTSQESIFEKFDDKAFAAASLGQVHKGTLLSGQKVAVKLQYPGVATSVKEDLKIIKLILKSFAKSQQLEESFLEIKERLFEEINYKHESQNAEWFAKQKFKLKIPKVFPEFSNEKLLVMEWLEGISLHEWMNSNPSQTEKDHIAQSLWDFFISSVFENQCLHADPNPGNFLVQPNGEIALLDFGCVKHFSKDFTQQLQQAFPLVLNSSSNNSLDTFLKHKLMKGNIPLHKKEEYNQFIFEFHQHIRQPYQTEIFDFGKNPEYVDRWMELGKKMSSMYKHVTFEADFIFLDRVRYGFMRFFTQMGARVKICNAYESGSK